MSLAGVWTLPSSGAASEQAAYGNVFLAGKLSAEAIRAKAYSGEALPSSCHFLDANPSPYRHNPSSYRINAKAGEQKSPESRDIQYWA